MSFLPGKIVSGGQTGVDRAALDVAMALGIPCGGWVPRGRLAEDGRLPERYPMTEAQSPEYPVRTELNVRDSDATLVLVRGAPTGGTRLTLDLCRRLGRTCRLVRLEPEEAAAAQVRRFLEEVRPAVLNVAGPRESTQPGVRSAAYAVLARALR